jgi:DNA-binding transcriptional MerR regulator
MEITLEKIELVKDRTGVSYKEAKEALEAADGSVVDAIISIEESIDIKSKSKLKEQSEVIAEKLKNAIRKGNVSKIIVRKGDDVILNLPVNVGIIGSVLAPWAAVAGVIAIFGTKCTVELVKDNGEVVDISGIASDTFENVVEKGAVIADEVMEKGSDVFENVKSKANEAISKAVKKESGLLFLNKDRQSAIVHLDGNLIFSDPGQLRFDDIFILVILDIYLKSLLR